MKRLIFEVEERVTECSYQTCPLYNACEPPYTDIFGVDCHKYNLATLKLIGEE